MSRRPCAVRIGFELAVEFVAVAVALADLGRAVRLRARSCPRPAGRIRAQPHGAAQFVHALQLAQLVDHAVRRGRIELGGVGVFEAAHVARELDHHRLHAQADAEVRHLVLAREADGVDHALDAALAESARDQNAVVASAAAARSPASARSSASIQSMLTFTSCASPPCSSASFRLL